MIYYVIPARAGSEGFPNKNRYLWKSTFRTIPSEWYDRTILSTDDLELIEKAEDFHCHMRKDQLCTATVHMREVLLDVANFFHMDSDDIIILLYLTYPQRTTLDIIAAIGLFEGLPNKSLLCKKEPLTHPYMCIKENGEQLIKHDLYRRQDYPVVYEISHFIGIFQVGEIKNLNRNLYNRDTYFMKIDEVTDVDYETDYDRLFG